MYYLADSDEGIHFIQNKKIIYVYDWLYIFLTYLIFSYR